MINERVKRAKRDSLTLDFLLPQAGDAAAPELHDAAAVGAGGVEEPDRLVHHAALPEHGQDPVVRSREDERQLK